MNKDLSLQGSRIKDLRLLSRVLQFCAACVPPSSSAPLSTMPSPLWTHHTDLSSFALPTVLIHMEVATRCCYLCIVHF